MATAPTYLYKIVPASAAPPDPLPDRLPVSPLDENDGFIHLSTANQVTGTLNRFFGDDQKIYLLRLKYSDLKPQIKWENPEGGEGKEGEEGVFPHLYNGNNLGKNEIESVADVDKVQARDKWEDALSSLISSGWLAL